MYNNTPTFSTKKNVREFEVVDVFNPQNTIKGFLHRTGERDYGALFIEEVNGVSVPQMIFAMPKLQYPYGYQKQDEDEFVFPSNAKKIYVYEKIDGTNIFAYRYYDKDGNAFVTYKTRLTPVLKAGRFGDFASMWKEMLVKYPDIPRFVKKLGVNLAFELYGKRNTILLEYDVSLDTRLLMGVGDFGVVYTPDSLPRNGFQLPDSPQLITTIYPKSNIVDEYQKMIEYLDEHIHLVEEFQDEQLYKGLEGAVFYPTDEFGHLVQWKRSSVPLFKCKPGVVRDIHWKEGLRGIPVHSIITTVKNAYEEEENPTLRLVISMLREEFSDTLIAKALGKIERLYNQVIAMKKIENIIFQEYLEKKEENSQFDINVDKRLVMRYFAALEIPEKRILGKRYSRFVYSILNRQFGEVE